MRLFSPIGTSSNISIPATSFWPECRRDHLCVLPRAAGMDHSTSHSPSVFVPNPAYSDQADLGYDRKYCNKILVDVIHGGDFIPDIYYQHLIHKNPQFEQEIMKAYFLEKDWGATQLAEQLSYDLGLRGHIRVNIARALMDYGRFPGNTPPGASFLDRHAINYPFSYQLDHYLKKRLLESCFDDVSNVYEEHILGKFLKIAVHSYDKYNHGPELGYEGTKRPDVSIIFQSLSIQEDKRMPFGLFDPMYPDVLAEFTADRRLTARISLTLEKVGISVAHNFPYCLPNGSVEIRAQVWAFFNYLKKQFEEHFPEKAHSVPYIMVWDMLMDTNLRSSESENLRSYLHMFRRALIGREEEFRHAREAYLDIKHFLVKYKKDVLSIYRRSFYRPSCIAIEVRKDLLWEFQDEGCTVPVMGEEGLKKENVAHLSQLLSEAIKDYLKKDRGSIVKDFFQ